MRVTNTKLRVTGALLLLLVACQTPRGPGTPSGTPFGTPMWSGARFTTEFRDTAVLRGLDFFYGIAGRAGDECFSEYASDYLWCFYTISASSADAP